MEELKDIEEKLKTIENELPYFSKKAITFLHHLMPLQNEFYHLIRIEIPELSDELVRVKLQNGFPLIIIDSLRYDMENFLVMSKRVKEILKISKLKGSRTINSFIKAFEKDAAFFEKFIKSALNEDYKKTRKLAKEVAEEFDLALRLFPFVFRLYLEKLAHSLSGKVNNKLWRRSYCPVCGGRPFFGILKGEERVRHLICVNCLTEWVFYRLKCPFCGNSDQKLLAYIFTEVYGECSPYRIDVCNKCKGFIKTADALSLKQTFIPRLDDIATMHLDFLALKEGFKYPTKPHFQFFHF